MSGKTVCQHLTMPLGASEEGWVLPNLMGKRSMMASLIVILRVFMLTRSTTPLGASEEGWVLPNLMGNRSVMASLTM